MTSALYAGTVVHQRYKPTRHRLRYAMAWMLFDLDAMPRLRLFSHNRFNLVSFHDRDHLDNEGSATTAAGCPGQKPSSGGRNDLARMAGKEPHLSAIAGEGSERSAIVGEGPPSTTWTAASGPNDVNGGPVPAATNQAMPVTVVETVPLTSSPPNATAASLRSQIEAAMSEAGLTPDGGPIRLLCMPRVLGHVFNPISVFFCHRRDETLAAILYEVHNTFGQRHSYLIPVEAQGGKTIRQHCAKAFYVSPFMRMDIDYDFRIVPPNETTVVVVNGDDAEGRVLSASFAGRRTPLTDRALLGMVLRHGLLSVKVLAAIHWEAARLWLKGLRLQPRPAPPGRTITIVTTPQG